MMKSGSVEFSFTLTLFDFERHQFCLLVLVVAKC